MMQAIVASWMDRSKKVMPLLATPVVFCLFAGCGKEAGPDPKMLSQGDTPEISKANNAMEDFMKTQGKSTPKK